MVVYIIHEISSSSATTPVNTNWGKFEQVTMTLTSQPVCQFISKSLHAYMYVWLLSGQKLEQFKILTFTLTQGLRVLYATHHLYLMKIIRKIILKSLHVWIIERKSDCRRTVPALKAFYSGAYTDNSFFCFQFKKSSYLKRLSLCHCFLPVTSYSILQFL